MTSTPTSSTFMARCAAGESFPDHDRMETMGLKPVDPLFAKNGEGTFLHIKVEGSSKRS